MIHRPLLTGSVRTASLITNNVKKTDLVPAGKPVMSIHVLPDGYMLLHTVVSVILLTSSSVPLLFLMVVHPIIP